MNQLYNQVSRHIVGYIGFITNYMANYLIAVKYVPLPRATARAARVTAVTARYQALTPVLYGLASVLLSSPMTKHRFSHESESFVQPPLIMRHHTPSTSSYYRRSTYLDYPAVNRYLPTAQKV